MNSTQPFTRRVAALAAIAMAVVLFTAGQASAMRLPPNPADPGAGYKRAGGASTLLVTNNSLSVLEWVLFAACVLGGLVVGATLMNLSQRHRAHLAL